MAQLATDLKCHVLDSIQIVLWDILQVVFYAIKGTCWYFPDWIQQLILQFSNKKKYTHNKIKFTERVYEQLCQI